MTRPAHYESDRVRIDKYVVGPFENNVFVVRSKASGEAVLVDAANEHELLLDVAKAANVRRILTTHGHWDHIQAVTPMRDAGFEVAVARDDAQDLPSYDLVIDDGDVEEIGEVRIRAVHTPGHTPGSVCFLVDGEPVLLSGDTLFPGGPGNTAPAGADFPTIIRSIETRLFPLPDDTIVMPGHGLDTTIGTERPHLGEWIERGW